MRGDLGLLQIQYATVFRLARSGRIAGENDPDRSPGPKMWLAGSAEGNVAGVRADVAAPVAREILALAADEPPFVGSDALPRHLDRYAALADGAARFGLVFELPKGLTAGWEARLVASGTAAGESLLARLAQVGLPDGLRDLGFRNVDEFWAPWCAVVADGDVAALAFAARLSGRGADVGVATAPAHRGRGYAGAAVAGWTQLPELADRALIYSCERTNAASQAVARKLGLRRIGCSLRIVSAG